MPLSPSPFPPDTTAADFLKQMSAGQGALDVTAAAGNIAGKRTMQHSGTDRYGRASLPPGFSQGSGEGDSAIKPPAPPMSIVAPPPIALPPHPSDATQSSSSTALHLQSPTTTIGFFPTPSPAACGKRKHAELTAAAMLATVGTGQKSEGSSKKSLSSR